MAAALACVLVLSLVLGGCGGTAKETVSMYDLRQVMLAADSELPEMKSVSSSDSDAESLFAYLAEMDYKKVDSFFLSYSSEGLADEIAVIALKDIADVSIAKKALEEHVDSRRKLYQQYEPSQAIRVDKAVLFTRDQYVVLIISEKADAVKSAFERFVAGE